jgi:hypothetical protein
MMLSISMQCTAGNSIQNALNWLFGSQHQEEHVQPVEQKNEAGVAAEDEEPEVETYEPEKIHLAQEDEDWVLSKLWKANVTEEEKEVFLAFLTVLSDQDLGMQKILRCTRNNVKIKYKQLTRLWQSPTITDQQLVQNVLNFLEELYSQTSIK